MHSLKHGKTSDISIQQNFDNSWRGLPYKPRQITKDEITKLRDSHVWTLPPTLENVELVFITADVMDDFISYAVWAWDVNDSLYMIEDGKTQWLELDEVKRKQVNEDNKMQHLPPAASLDDILDKDYLKNADGVGIKPTLLLIDQGGHRAEEVKHFARMHKNVFMQKGTSMTSITWKFSDTQSKLILSAEKNWKATAIFYLYSQKNRNENYLWFSPSISEETLSEIRDVKPDETSKWGNDPSNWVSKTGKDHAFDLVKYAYLAKDFMLQSLSKTKYRFGKSPSILRRWEKMKKKEEHSQQAASRSTSWFSV